VADQVQVICNVFESERASWRALRGSKNWPYKFPGQTSYEVTRPGFILIVYFIF